MKPKDKPTTVEIIGTSTSIKDYRVKINNEDVTHSIVKINLILDAEKSPLLEFTMIPDNVAVIAKIPSLGTVPHIKIYYMEKKDDKQDKK